MGSLTYAIQDIPTSSGRPEGGWVRDRWTLSSLTIPSLLPTPKTNIYRTSWRPARSTVSQLLPHPLLTPLPPSSSLLTGWPQSGNPKLKVTIRNINHDAYLMWGTCQAGNHKFCIPNNHTKNLFRTMKVKAPCIIHVLHLQCGSLRKKKCIFEFMWNTVLHTWS